ncbi:unnamed protein product [Allacma fusca]|uniref:F-box protein n=1 Tax=Allacma fusca TaxID=39272 RepID=A0A8J2JAR3_9HEXA|nr:unnamed protein product [Allacma fusca]
MSDQFDQSSVNGFILCGKFIPETALEILLSFVPVSDILKLRRVCQLWKDIVSRRSFWKEAFERNGLNWKAIPNNVKEKEDAWIVLFCALKHRIFTKNFVRNHSGEAQFTHWEKLQDGGDRIIIESPPGGISPLPINPDYASGIESAFVTSYGWSTIRQKIDLKEAGLTPEVMKAMIPFQFVCTPMVGIRFDCAAMYCICLCLLDNKGKAVIYNISDGVHQAGENWIQACCTLNVLQEPQHIKKVRHLAVIISGKDNQFWAGHYGPKFSRISVTAKCLTSEEAETVEPHRIHVRNQAVSDLFSMYGRRDFWNEMLPNAEAEAEEEESEESDDRVQRRTLNCSLF